MKRKKICSVVAAAVLSASILSCLPPATVANALDGAVLEHTQYMLRNAGSGKYLTVSNGTAANGSNVVQYTADGVADYNTWNITPGADGYYYIYSQLSGGSQYLLDLDQSNTADGTNVDISEDSHSDAQLFKFVKNEDETYTIVTKITEDQSALDMKDASAEDGASVQERTINGDNSQKWFLEPVSDLIPGDLDMDHCLTGLDLSAFRSKLSQDDFRIFEKGISDVNGDGIVGTDDIAMLQDFLLARIDQFGIQKVLLPENTISPVVEEGSTKIEYTAVTANVKDADSADITLTGTPNAEINGTISYQDSSTGKQMTTQYAATLDETGSYTFHFTVPDGAEEIRVEISWSGVWDDEKQANVDTEAEISNIEVYTTPKPPAEDLIEAPVKAIHAATSSTGDVKMLAIYVDFSDKTYSSEAYTNEQLENELFGTGQTAFPYESLTAWFERSSYGNLHLDGDVYRFTCSGNMSEYQNGGFEKMVMEVLNGLDSQIDYADYDANDDGVIDCISFTVPLDGADDETLEYWYGCTATWYDNPNYSVDDMRLTNYIIMDVMPYSANMQYMKQTYIHEMGHSMGLPDYYKYQSSDWEGLHGDAGYTRMDDSIADFCGFSKLMYGWLKESEIQTYTGSGTQTFALSDASNTGSCLILPISSSEGDYTSEYFFIEYITPSQNNSDMYASDSGIRIFHIQAELFTTEWGDTTFKYENYSQYYVDDDNIRVIKLVNDGNGFFHTGDSVSYGTSNFAGYDASGNQTIDTGYEISIGTLSNGKYSVTVSKN